MPFQGRVCVRGVWDESVPGISFDEQGICNYARLHDQLCSAYPRGEKGLSEWKRLTKMILENGKNKNYDCIIGVSGGTDSSYLLHIAKEEGLRPLAVNLDNGWSSDIAVKNIKKITTALNIDLETYVIEYEEIKDLLRSYMLAGLAWVDIPTDLAIKSILYKIAAREGVRYVLRGNDFRSEGSQPYEWTYGDGRQLLAIHKIFGQQQLKTFPNYTLSNLFYYGFFCKIKSIYPFYYIDYQKNKAQEFLIRTYNWEYYGGHHHENLFTKFVMSYWLFEKFGIDKRKITYSAQILSGEITREYAMEQIGKLPYDPETIEVMIDFVLKKLDLTKEQFLQIMGSPKYTYIDYPSYDYIFRSMIRFSRPFLRLIFLHKPQSVYQAEMRKNN